MSRRPITLFTGQWADLPFKEVCQLASQWGYDGLEIACWGDHLDVARGASDDAYLAERKRSWPTTASRCTRSPTTSPARPCAITRSTSGTRASCPPGSGGMGSPRASGSGAAEDMKDTARTAARLGVDTVVGFTGSSIWHTVAMFPPVPPAMIERGYADFADRWNPILDVFDEVGVRFAHEVHPSESLTTTGRRSAPWRRSATGRRSA